MSNVTVIFFEDDFCEDVSNLMEIKLACKICGQKVEINEV